MMPTAASLRNAKLFAVQLHCGMFLLQEPSLLLVCCILELRGVYHTITLCSEGAGAAGRCGLHILPVPDGLCCWSLWGILQKRQAHESVHVTCSMQCMLLMMRTEQSAPAGLSNVCEM